MITKPDSKQSGCLAGWLFASVALVAFTGAPPGGSISALAQGAPRIVSTSPKNGATDVDPGLAEITVTFDQDMEPGMSWTGGGPQFPVIPSGKQAAWRDKRTCVLPVKLVGGHRYRVGINAPSYRNFRSASGVEVTPTAILFTTTGASSEAVPDSKPPMVVNLNPANGAQDVSPSTTMLTVTFNVAMDEGFSWTGGGSEFPTIPEGRRPYWTKDHKTAVLPVTLKPGSSYRLGLNSVSFKNFRSAAGVPLEPVAYTFKTAGQ